MHIPKDCYYTKTHEWAKREDGKVRVGVTDYAQQEITDVVYVELPEVGKRVKREEPIAVVESVKAAFDIYAPVSGVVTELNEELREKPELVNQDPYGKGFFFVLTLEDEGELEALLTPEAYEKEVAAH